MTRTDAESKIAARLSCSRLERLDPAVRSHSPGRTPVLTDKPWETSRRASRFKGESPIFMMAGLGFGLAALVALFACQMIPKWSKPC